MRLLPCAFAAFAACSVLAALALGGVDDAAVLAPTETLAERPWVETLEVDGDIKAAASTPLTVPGSGWDNRDLLEMVEDGRAVKKGDVIARFDAPQARIELSQAEMELLRKELGVQTLVDQAAMSRAALSADSAKVKGDLDLSERYADIKVESGVLTRNQILDALQDTGFLKNKRSYLGWKTGQLDVRTAAERAVMVSQKDSVSLTAGQRRKSLATLELIAPHDGVFLLAAKWDGSKPQLGASLRAGQEFGKLPDPKQLIATFSVAEAAAFGLKPGLPVRARLAGTGTEFDLTVTKVGSNASAKSRESPVKYSELEAAIDPALAARLGLTPGQAVHATVRLVDRPAALTLPNLALVQDGAAYSVFVGDQPPGVRQIVELGQRGPVRSEIKSGLRAGSRVLLVPVVPDKKDKDKKMDKKPA
ncbi:MAG: HlyD family secretion protein [Massilia sp.]|jgi:HlyD family secretion protein|nr:HlyD family secretion protein [Massilia sp.]